MPAKNDDLHGNVPDRSAIALLLIDVINDLEFEDGAALREAALPAAERLARLRRRAKAARVPVIYANDNFGRWRSDFKQQLAHVIDENTRGRPIAELLRPDDDDYVVLKAKHSAFFHTQLDLLVEYLHVKTVIVTGFTTHTCVLFTAGDAYMRDLHIIVPPDCAAAANPSDHAYALEYMASVMDALLLPSDDIDFEVLRSARTAE